QDFVVEFGLQGLPVNIEEFGEFGGASIGQHVPPPGIGAGIECHVVGNDVENLPQAVTLELMHKRLQIGVGADFGIQRVVVSDVVTVHAAGTGLQNGRRVNVRDAERVQIADETARVLKTESGIELQTIRGKWASSMLVGRQPVKTFRDAAGFGDED